MVKPLPGKRRLEVLIPEATYLALKGASAMNQARICDLVDKAIRKYLHGNPLVTHWPPEYHRDFRKKWPPQGDPVNPHASTQDATEKPDSHEIPQGRTYRKPGWSPPARVETPKKVG
jgi:hypothetical protein